MGEADKGIGAAAPARLAPNRVIRLTPARSWDPEAVNRHFAQLSPAVAEQRRLHGRGRVVLDMTAWEVQSQANADVIQQGIRATYRPGDRVALVTPSHLIRLQVRRVAGGLEVRGFDRVADAEDWVAQD